jgi:DNA-binding transcriptional MocR family regulator
MNSYEYQDAVLASDLSSSAKLTALAISYHYNWQEANRAFPSVASLVKRTSLSRATIHRAKKELIDAGYLDSIRRYNKSNLYLPMIPTQSHGEISIVSHRRTNNELNYEYNNEYKEKDSEESLVIFNNNIQGKAIPLEEYWKAFG